MANKFSVRARGFTMVEMVIVIVVLGILSAVAASRFIDRGNFDAPAYAGKVKSLLRYGQKLAVAQNRPVYASVFTDAVALCFDAACAVPVPAPSGANSGSAATLAACSGSGTWYCEGKPQDVPMTAGVTLPHTFFFDEQGRPFSGSDATGSDASSFAGLAITIGAGAGAQAVNVEPETGYVH